MRPARRYFEHFHPGQEIAAGGRTVSEEEIVGFAMQFDPQPFHIVLGKRPADA